MRKAKLACWWFFLLTTPVVIVAQSQSSEVGVDYEVGTKSIFEALIVDIHGSGYLDLTKLQIEPTVTKTNSDSSGNDEVLSLQAAVVPLTAGTTVENESGNDDVVMMSSAGLGAKGKDGKYYTCCSESAVQAESCTEEELGQLIVSSDDIKVRSVEVSLNTNNSSSFGMRNGVVRISKTSHAALVFGNCQSSSSSDGGTVTLHVHGKVSWASYVVEGMLPFYALVTSIHAGLCLWYGRLMLVNKESRIQVEHWIFFTISLAALTAMFETTKFVIEVYGSNEIMFFKITSMLLSLARHSVTRCLYLVLSLGLGVATASLSRITTVLIVVFLAVDVFLLWSMHLAFFMNIHIHIPFTHQLIRITEYIFSFWIPIALCRTMYYLRIHGENMKLVRYKWFLKIYVLTALLTYLESFLNRRDWNDNGGRRFNRSTMREANDIIYLVPLACVAILWKPNPQQQMYSYVLLEDDEENTTEAMNKITDIELTENVDGEEE